MKKIMPAVLAVLVVLMAGLAQAGGEVVEGHVERFAYKGFDRYIQVGGKTYLVNRTSRIEVMRGKQLLLENTGRYLKVGTKIKAWISSIDGKPWAKIIAIKAPATPPPPKPGQTKVPVVRPEK